MVCPRCGRESSEGAALCRRCGAPLLIPEDPPARPLDVSLDLDRRALRGPSEEARNTVPGTPPPPAPRRPPLPAAVAGAPTVPPRGPVPPVKVPVAPRAAPAAAPVPPPLRSASPAPEEAPFFAPPFTPLPQAEVEAPPPREAPPEYEPYAFADLPEDDPPGLAEPAMSEADGAFAELGEAMRAGTPLPFLSPLRPPTSAPPPAPAGAHAHPSSSAPPAAPAGSHAGGERAIDAPPPLSPTPARPRPAPRPPAPEPELPEAEVTSIEIHVRRAPTWRRVAAWAVDAVPLVAALAGLARWPGGGTGGGLLDLALSDGAVALSLAAVIALALFSYGTLAHALGGATLGKLLLGLRVVGPDGARPTLTRSAVRSAGSVVSLAMAGLGLLLALFTRSGRALHDLVARTWVVEAP